MKNKFIKFINAMGKVSGQESLCEAIGDAFKLTRDVHDGSGLKYYQHGSKCTPIELEDNPDNEYLRKDYTETFSGVTADEKALAENLINTTADSIVHIIKARVMDSPSANIEDAEDAMYVLAMIHPESKFVDTEITNGEAYEIVKGHTSLNADMVGTLLSSVKSNSPMQLRIYNNSYGDYCSEGMYLVSQELGCTPDDLFEHIKMLEQD